MKELDQFTVERLKEVTINALVSMDEASSLARVVLAVKLNSEPHKRREIHASGNTWIQCSKQAYDRAEAAGGRVRILYERPVLNSPEIPDGWVSCSERMPEVGEHDWRTAFPMLVNCEIGVIPAYYGFTYHEGEQCYGFLESLKFGDASGDRPEQYESKLMRHVTHWMPLPAAPKPEK